MPTHGVMDYDDPLFKHYWLVVTGTCFIFPYIGNNNPNWLFFFSEGLKPPTRKPSQSQMYRVVLIRWTSNHQTTPCFHTAHFSKYIKWTLFDGAAPLKNDAVNLAELPWYRLVAYPGRWSKSMVGAQIETFFLPQLYKHIKDIHRYPYIYIYRYVHILNIYL